MFPVMRQSLPVAQPFTQQEISIAGFGVSGIAQTGNVTLELYSSRSSETVPARRRISYLSPQAIPTAINYQPDSFMAVYGLYRNSSNPIGTYP